MACGLETIGGREAGAGQYEELGYVTQLGVIILTIVATAISLSWTLPSPSCFLWAKTLSWPLMPPATCTC
jgi:Na+-driven multidrug efflux pump